jgi:hypothetical protein
VVGNADESTIEECSREKQQNDCPKKSRESTGQSLTDEINRNDSECARDCWSDQQRLRDEFWAGEPSPMISATVATI